MRAERINDGHGGLARRAVADRDVRSPARGLAIRCMRPGDLMGRRARGVIDRRQRLGRCDAEHDGFGMVEDLTEGDGGGRRAREKVGGAGATEDHQDSDEPGQPTSTNSGVFIDAGRGLLERTHRRSGIVLMRPSTLARVLL